MKNSNAPSPLRAADYEAIEAALLETVRGRWFLAEFSKRNRSADTNMLLDAISKLEATVLNPQAQAQTPDAAMRRDLIEMAEAISQTRKEIAAMGTSEQDDSKFTSATEELDAIVEATEKATSDILEAAEDVQELAWLLREKDTDDEACDRLDARATDIYTACSFQDLTGQRTSKVVKTLRFLESRVHSMINIWGLDDIIVQDRPQPEDERPDAHLLNGPALGDQGVDQGEVDQMLNGAHAEESATAAGQPASAEPQTDTPIEAEDFPAVTAAPDEPAGTEPQPTDPGVVASGQMAKAVRKVVAGEVEAAEFTEPADLKIEELDDVQKTALFS
ncbi:MAG: protein phosphatase CheZ [Hyphomicrobiaceae bacterium]|nr:protein phosphatase CheZ [Hyphomicrobiaceae bacterium]